MVLDKKYLVKIENISFKPIFILGIHRSGTSILYKILSEIECFNSVTAYHCIKYDELLHNYFNKEEKNAKGFLNNYLQKQGQTDRGIDKLKISVDFKEEYRFIFTNRKNKPWIDQNNLKLFIELCKKIQLISNNDKPLLLKNPYDYSNFVFIKNVFPDAKFIFIHRNPLNVTNSNIKSIRTLFKEKNHYTSLLSKGYNNVYSNPLSLNLYRFFLQSSTFIRCIRSINGFQKSTDYFFNNISNLDEKSYISIKYESLCENPSKEIEKIIKFLDVKPKNKIDYDKQIKPKEIKLIKELEILKSYSNQKMKKYNSYFKY